jgi:hypothetical protein
VGAQCHSRSTHPCVRRSAPESAVAWQKLSPKAASEFIEELHRAADTIRVKPRNNWPVKNTRRFLLWRVRFAILYSEHESVGPTAAGSRSIGHVACRGFKLGTILIPDDLFTIKAEHLTIPHSHSYN